MPAILRPSDFTVYFVVHPFNSPMVYYPLLIKFLPHSTFSSTSAFHSIYDEDESSTMNTIEA